MRIVDADGDQLPSGQVGEVIGRGDDVMPGETAAAELGVVKPVQAVVDLR